MDSLDPQGPAAEAIADLWWLMFVLGTAVFVLFLGLLIRGLTRRAPEPSEGEPRRQHLVGRWIGVGGVALPTVVIVVVFAATLVALRELPRDAPDGALEIEVVGHQFWYEIRYPESGLVTANELHLPTGRPIALELRSRDVIHSFWVPALGGKMDMLPERINTLVLEADQPGEHWSRCAEFCGLQHANMQLLVVVESPSEFEDWMSRQQAIAEPQGDLALQGRELFVSADCVACHALRGQGAAGTDGPDLTTLPQRRTLGAMSMENTPENLISWITDPDSVKPGVDMPATALSQDELDALLAYLGVER